MVGKTIDMKAEDPALGQILLEKATSDFKLLFLVCKMEELLFMCSCSSHGRTTKARTNRRHKRTLGSTLNM